MLSRMLMMKSPGPPTAALVVSFGESNSGGYALNSDAASWEIAARPELRFWNVNTSIFEDIDIGTNNNLDHVGLNSTTHGWELGLANRVRQGFFGSRTVYYVQTGQGTSTVSQWNVGGSYWTKFLSRVTAAKAALNGIVYTSHVWVSLGINDAIATTNDATYKTAMQDIIGRIKTELPGCKVYVATLPPVNGTYTTYSTRINEIASEDASNVRAVSVTSPATMSMRDANHWSYSGIKRLANRMVYATLLDTTISSGKDFVWSSNSDGTAINLPAVNQHAACATPIDVTSDGSVVFEFHPDGNGQFAILDNSTAAVNYGSGTDIYYAFAQVNGGTIYSGEANGPTNINSHAGISLPAWGRFKWFAANDDLLFETSNDGGTTWTTRRTYTNRMAGVSQAFVKSLSSASASYMDIWRA